MSDKGKIMKIALFTNNLWMMKIRYCLYFYLFRTVLQISSSDIVFFRLSVSVEIFYFTI